VQRGDQWASTSRYTNNRGTTTRATQGSGGGEAITRRGPRADSGVARTGSGDMYAGRDGNVYRKEQGGSWQKYDNGGWNNVQQPTDAQRQQAQQRADQARSDRGTDSSTMGQLNRDSAARSEGAQRTTYSGSGRAGSSSSYRPSGGYGGGRSVSRGGGGGRRR
jgi:hypothetical protein